MADRFRSYTQVENTRANRGGRASSSSSQAAASAYLQKYRDAAERRDVAAGGGAAAAGVRAPSRGASPSRGGQGGARGAGGGKPGTTGFSLGRATLTEIQAHLEALRDQYGLSIGQLGETKSRVGDEAGELQEDLARGEQLGLENVIGSFVGRGLYNSGIRLREETRLREDVQRRRDDISEELGYQLKDLQFQAQGEELAFNQAIQDFLLQVNQLNLPPAEKQSMLDELENLSYQNLLGGLDFGLPGAQPTAPTAPTPNATRNRFNKPSMLGAISQLGGGRTPIR